MRQRIRRALVLVTVVAVVIGPQWCCCTLKKAVASSSAIADEATGCCCCCDASESESASACPLNPGDGEGRHSCPCRGKPRPVAATLGGVASGAEAAAESRFGWEGTWHAACGLQLLVAYIHPEVGGVPALNAPVKPGGRALLRALSILRC